MLDAFGQYTYQIISRLTLIFTQLSLNGNNVQKEIRNAIVSSMDGDFLGNENEVRLTKWRQFFREYLRYVSKIRPKLRNYVPRMNSTYDEMEARPQFTEAFCVRSATDNRKYQEFLNLVRGFARLYGDDEINWRHLEEARDLFEVSLQTLTEEFPLSMMMKNVDNELIEVYKKIMKNCPVAESLKEIRESVKITNEQIETLVRSEAITRFDNGTYFLNEDWLEKMEVSIDE
jgi:sarcosine oxidase delta subunit